MKCGTGQGNKVNGLAKGGDKIRDKGRDISGVPSVYDRVALLLAIKEQGKNVEFTHVYEKVQRDVLFIEKRKVAQDEIEGALKKLTADGYVVKKANGYSATEEIGRLVETLIREKRGELNRSYVTVWLAKRYYPHVADAMLPFLSGRAVSAVKIFSGKSDPIRDVDAIFVRYAKYKPKPVFLTIESRERLLELVFDHCVDFIPYVHKIGASEPDIFVLDLDAGSELLKHPQAFDFVKHIASELATFLYDLGIECMVKFSGSRGFQIWTHLDNEVLRGEEDIFRTYREMATALQERFEGRLQKDANDIQREFPNIIEKGRPITTSEVAHKLERASQILIDWSVLKPMGDVRAPFSMHHKTGLVSLPLPLTELLDFDLKDADPLSVIQSVEKYRGASAVKMNDPSRLLAIRKAA